MAAVTPLTNDIGTAAAASERTPLLRRDSNSSAESGSPRPSSSPSRPTSPQHASRSFVRRTTLLICSVAFVLLLGTNMQPAARIQIYEDVICSRYYADHRGSPLENGLAPAPTPSPKDRCKIQPVQDELALIKGYELFLSLLPALLCTIPYGRLADDPKVGRRRVLILNLFGQVLSELFSLVICWWSDVLPLRLIWLGGLIQFIGGGPAVGSSIVYTMIADYAADAERTQIFLWVHAATTVAGLVGPVVGAALLREDLAWGAAALALVVEAAGLSMTFALPETLHLRRTSELRPDGPDADLNRDDGQDGKPWSSSLRGRWRSLLAPFIAVARVCGRTPQVILLLLLYGPSVLARSAFSLIGLLYTNRRFSVPYSTGSLALSLNQGVEALLIFVVIPLATRLVSSPSSMVPKVWSAWKRDRIFTVASCALYGAGHTALGLAPGVWLAMAGLVATGFAAGGSSFIMSLLAGAVGPEDVSVVYSAALMLGVIMSTGAGPVASALLTKGMQLGGQWEGLPFIVVGGLMFVTMMATFLIAREKEDIKRNE